MRTTYLLDLLEGDILLKDDAGSRASVNKQIYLWPGGIVPYVLDSGLSMCSFPCNLLFRFFTVFNTTEASNENIKTK